MKANEYDAWYDTDRGGWIGETEYRLALRRLAPQPGERLLDVGCGTGWFTRKFARLPGAAVTGVDIDQDALTFARTKDPLSTYLTADARQLAFQDRQFDLVFSMTALCFIEPWQQALTEIVRVTRQRFVIGLLNRHSLLWKDKGQHGGTGAYKSAHWHTAHEIRSAMAHMPVNHVRIDYAIFLPGGSILSRLAENLLPSQTPLGSVLLVSGKCQ